MPRANLSTKNVPSSTGTVTQSSENDADLPLYYPHMECYRAENNQFMICCAFQLRPTFGLDSLRVILYWVRFLG